MAAGIALLVGLLTPTAAYAASSSFTVGDGAVVQVWAGANSTITVKSWDRPSIQLDTDDEAVQVQRRPLMFGTAQNPLSVSIPLATVKISDPMTGGQTMGSLPPEDFPYASDFRAGVHDTVRIVTAESSHTTVMLPSTTAILDTRVRGIGTILINDYHGGTMFVNTAGGRTVLTNVTTSAFIQVMNGRLRVVDSSFDRLRARGNTTAFIFQHSRARQIELTTISGPIVYDNGTFDPGLARFQSQSGTIAIGVANGAQVDARSTDGRVFDLWDRPTPIGQRSDNEASATIGGGGPLVNAVTRGNIYLYDGSFKTRRALPAGWQRLQAIARPRQQQNDEDEPNAFRRFRKLRPN